MHKFQKGNKFSKRTILKLSDMTVDQRKAEITRRILRLQRRIAITANPRIKKWAEKALSLGRYQDCYWILKIESISDPQKYEKWLSWLKRTEKTLI